MTSYRVHSHAGGSLIQLCTSGRVIDRKPHLISTLSVGAGVRMHTLLSTKRLYRRMHVPALQVGKALIKHISHLPPCSATLWLAYSEQAVNCAKLER